MRSACTPLRAITLVLLTALVGCGGSVLGLDSDGTDEVRVALSVSEGSPEITYIFTNDFGVQPLADGSLEVRMRWADTITTALPLDRKFQTGDRQRVFFQVIERSQVESQLNLRVWLDENPSIQDAFSPDDPPLQVLYMFGDGVITTEEITVT